MLRETNIQSQTIARMEVFHESLSSCLTPQISLPINCALKTRHTLTIEMQQFNFFDFQINAN